MVTSLMWRNQFTSSPKEEDALKHIQNLREVGWKSILLIILIRSLILIIVNLWYDLSANIKKGEKKMAAKKLREI